MKGTSYEILNPQTADSSSQEAVINTKETTSEKTSPEVHTHSASTDQKRGKIMKTQLIPKLSERNACLISKALKTCGSEHAYDYIVEDLYLSEAESVRLFIEWIDKNHHKASPEFRFVEENFPNLYENFFLKEYEGNKISARFIDCNMTMDAVVASLKTYAVFLFDGKKEGWDAYTYLKDIETNSPATAGDEIFRERFTMSAEGSRPFNGKVKIHGVKFERMISLFRKGNGLKEIVLAERINNQPTTKERN